VAAAVDARQVEVPEQVVMGVVLLEQREQKKTMQPSILAVAAAVAAQEPATAATAAPASSSSATQAYSKALAAQSHRLAVSPSTRLHPLARTRHKDLIWLTTQK
jgi:hypothetical protein